jgi:hypothetical protein
MGTSTNETQRQEMYMVSRSPAIRLIAPPATLIAA